MKRRAMMGGKKLFVKRFFPAGNYTWTVPPGCTEVEVFLVGAGGGAGSWTNSWGCHGAGGGGYTKTYRGKGYIKPETGTWMGTYEEGRDGDAIAVKPGQVIPIVVGAGVINDNGGYSQFLNSNYRAEGGNVSRNWTYGGNGGSGGGCWNGYNASDDSMRNGASDGHDTRNSKGQGHTTRDFGEPEGKRNAGGGCLPGRYAEAKGGESDYAEGEGGTMAYSPTGFDNHFQALVPGGGYGGGANNVNYNSDHYTKGGDGTVLIRYWAYHE